MAYSGGALHFPLSYDFSLPCPGSVKHQYRPPPLLLISSHLRATSPFAPSPAMRCAEDLDELELAYALTVHKAQGGQFPCVVLFLDVSHRVLLHSRLLYTALSRASSLLIVVCHVTQSISGNRSIGDSFVPCED